jgi:hypothetical protein
VSCLTGIFVLSPLGRGNRSASCRSNETDFNCHLGSHLQSTFNEEMSRDQRGSATRPRFGRQGRRTDLRAPSDRLCFRSQVRVLPRAGGVKKHEDAGGLGVVLHDLGPLGGRLGLPGPSWAPDGWCSSTLCPSEWRGQRQPRCGDAEAAGTGEHTYVSYCCELFRSPL